MKVYIIPKLSFGWLFLCVFCISAWGQRTPQQVNYAIDNMSYWREMTKRGLVQPTPNRPVPKATSKECNKSVRRGAGETECLDGDDVLVRDDPDNTQSENSIFVNPGNPLFLLNSNNSIDINPTGNFRTVAFTSTDGANTWNGDNLAVAGTGRADPAVVISNDGTYFDGHIDFGFGQAIAISNNNGATWTSTNIATAAAGQVLDKNHLWIDNSMASIHEGNLYSAWTPLPFFGLPTGAVLGQVAVSRSTNGGTTWGAPVVVSTGTNAGVMNQGVNIQTGPNGDVYVTWAVYDAFPGTEAALGFCRSTDGGQTFSAATRIIDDLNGVRWQPGGGFPAASPTGANIRSNSFPSMTVDPGSGDIFIVWANNGVPGINTGADVDVYVIRSSDNGATWSTPARVNTDAPGNGNSHFFPWITCDPTTGNLFVIFYDNRATTGGQFETWVAFSDNGGASWDDFRVSDVAFTPQGIPGVGGNYMGDYLGISARDGFVYPCWTDNRSGRALTYVSPFFLGCPDELTLTDPITSGTTVDLEADQFITASNVVESGANATYDAGIEVLLEDGFVAENGSEFHAFIDGCGNLRIGNTVSSITPAQVDEPEFGMRVSPNPFSDRFRVKFSLESEQAVQLFLTNMMGQVVLETIKGEMRDAGTHEVNCDAGHLAAGIYLCHLVVNNRIESKKVILSK